MRILAIDPGTKESGYVVWDGERLTASGVASNHELLRLIEQHVKRYEVDVTGITSDMRTITLHTPADILVLEMIDAMGMAVGKEVFETVRWTGRFEDRWSANHPREPWLVYRKDIKMHLCGSMRAKDKNIRQALIDRIGKQGTKKNPGPTYGVSSHIWAALAVAVYAHDLLGAKTWPM